MMKSNCLRILLAAACAAAFLWTGRDAMASVTINGTRVVYPSEAREVTVQLDNVGSTPSLVQAWVDSGDASQTPDNSDAPFLLTPPISRIEPRRSQALRLVYTGTGLPADRESVFYLNVLDVPPAPDDGQRANYLQIALRSRIKLFYRPAGLAGTANDAPGALRWSRVDDAHVRANNPTPYFVSLSEVRAGVTEDGALIEERGTMLAPQGSVVLTLPAGYDHVNFVAINDYGGQVRRIAALAPP